MIDFLKKAVVVNIKSLKRNFRKGSLPDFIIIGAQKSGTTALYEYISQHPGIITASRKEVHFFDRPLSRHKGISWYKKFFPNLSYKCALEDNLGHKVMSGEATGAYLFHPLVPQLIYQLVTNQEHKLKFIVLLREPISRAFSHYNHNLRYPNREQKSFHEAIILEDDRISGEIEKLRMDSNYHPTKLLRYSYAKRGFYMEQLERWMQYFDKQDFLIVPSLELLKNPNETTNSVFEFLQLPKYQALLTNPRHVGDYKKDHILPETYNFLKSKLENENLKLNKFLGKKFW